MSPRSSTLFHFTKSMDVLFTILSTGFWPRYCLEDVQWQGHKSVDYIAFPMVCFCDIPLGRIAEHVGFYGSFGIGLTKDWGAKNNLNPVSYYAGDNPAHQAIKSLTSAAFTLPDEKAKQAALKNVRYLLAHAKPTSGRMIVAGVPVVKEFYQESEWRFVPQHQDVPDTLGYQDFQLPEVIEKVNGLTANLARLGFLPTDVRYIFVPTDADIPAIMNFIQVALDRYPSADLKVLMSRVTSLESLSLDV